MSDFEPETQSDLGGAPPVDPPQIELETPPPGWPKVVGIISLAWGALGLTCGLIARIGGIGIGRWGIGQALKAEGLPVDDTQIPPMLDFTPVVIGGALGGAVVSSLLIAAGVMCMGRKSVARPLHLSYAFVTILFLVIAFVLGMQSQAEMQQWITDHPDAWMVENGQTGGQQSNMILGIIMTAIFCIWPLFCIFWFGALGKKPEIGKPDYI